MLGADLAYATAAVPKPDELMSPADIARLHTSLCQMKSLDEADGEWPHKLRRKCSEPSFATETSALAALFVDTQKLVEARSAFIQRPVEFPIDGLGQPKTTEAVERGATTGKPFGFVSIGAGAAKEHIAKVKVSGLTPTSADDWQHVQKYLRLHSEIVSFESRWNIVADVLELPIMQRGVSKLRTLELVTVTARKAHQVATEFDARLPRAAEAVFARAPEALRRGSLEDFESARAHVLQHLTRAELADASIALSQLQERLAGKTGTVSVSLQAFIDTVLGNPAFESARVAPDYTELVVELRRVTNLADILARVKDCSSRLSRAGAEKLAYRVLTVPATNGEDVAFPPAWREAWNWARIRAHLEQIEARAELVELNERRTTMEAGLAKLYRNLVAHAAWVATKRNASPKVLQALAGYATAIRRIGQGTGPNAVRYRRDAQTAMQDAAGAVPCWIMSHARVSESMPADIGAFDLVIVDEASQSDLWALPAIVRAKKILVVGDDKQVSPDGGFISSGRIDELHTRFLAEQPFGRDMTPEKSLYDLAARVFAAEQVVLREHFRCVPPIISYSNRFYKGAIQPLRIPRASERLDPPLIDIYVPDGMRDRRECNKLEAEAIAEEIEALLDDERYSGRSIGVVSLLGMEQAKYIDTLVRERCSAVELLHREFACGDARTFQGSERDIMFLSMVADREQCHALSGAGYDQRFNVAASRARDRSQLVLKQRAK